MAREQRLLKDAEVLIGKAVRDADPLNVDRKLGQSFGELYYTLQITFSGDQGQRYALSWTFERILNDVVTCSIVRESPEPGTDVFPEPAHTRPRGDSSLEEAFTDYDLDAIRDLLRLL